MGPWGDTRSWTGWALGLIQLGSSYVLMNISSQYDILIPPHLQGSQVAPLALKQWQAAPSFPGCVFCFVCVFASI